MRNPTTKRRRRRDEWQFRDFQAVVSLSDDLEAMLQTLFHLDAGTWDFALAKIRQQEAYRRSYIPKGKGRKPRPIDAPAAELKAVQRAILFRFLSQVPVHFARHGGQRGEGILDAVRHHATLASHVFTVDIVNAFPSVTRARVRANLRGPLARHLTQFDGVELARASKALREQFRKAKGHEDRQQVLAEILKHPFDRLLEAVVDLLCLHDRLPQGAPTSPRVLDVVCMEMDRKIWKYLHERSSALQEYRYTRYVDDCTVSSDGDITVETQRGVLEIMRSCGFTPHVSPEKMKYFSPETGERPVVLGLVIGDDCRVTMAPRKANQLRSRLHRLFLMEAWDDAALRLAQGTIAFIRYVYPEKLPAKLRRDVEAIEARIGALRKTSREPVTPLSANALFTDGASQGNPGPSAIGVLLMRSGATVVEFGRGIDVGTNNRAEYLALIEGLRAAKEAGMTELDCFLDAELVVQQLLGKLRTRSSLLQVLCAQVRAIAKDIGSVRFHWLPREQNSRADTLARRALHPEERKRKGRRRKRTGGNGAAEAIAPGGNVASDLAHVPGNGDGSGGARVIPLRSEPPTPERPS